MFSTVELNASFYRLPQIEVVKMWAKQTSEDFVFCPKLSRYITHIKRLHDSEEALKEFIHRFRPLKKKLGPILIQLPPSFKFDRKKLSPFFQLLAKYRTFDFVLEARHSSWIVDEALELLSHYKIGWVIADSGSKYPTLKEATSENVYFRFHGREKLYGSSYARRELLPFVKFAQQSLKEGKWVFAFFNNDNKGYAVKNAVTFEQMVRGK